MAAISITATNVIAADGAVSKQEFVAGATIAAGDWVYVDTANSNVLKLAQADGTVLEATVKGMALNGGVTGQPIMVATSGDVAVGAVLTVADTYILSATAGKMDPVADLASSSYLSIVGFGTTTSNFRFHIKNSGIEKA
jgi:outer membrane protein assembly factor BamB